MKWDELTAEQRDRLVHEKVMNLATVCPGKLVASHVKVPSRAGGTAYSYWQLACDTCETVGYSDSEENIPKEHPPEVGIPDYTTDMNAAWRIVEKLYERFDVRILLEGDNIEKYYIQIWTKDGTDRMIGYGSSKESIQEAIIEAALRAVGLEV